MGALIRATWGVSCAAIFLGLGCEGAEGPAGPAGKDGADGQPCAVEDNGDGTKTITCPDSDPVTIANGAAGKDGTSCSVTDNGDGTKTITCTDDTSVTVSDAAPCTAEDDGMGNKVITCPGSDPVTVKDGTSCTVVDAGGGVAILSCSDGTHVFISPPIDTHLDPWEDLPGVVPVIVAIGGGSNADSFAPGDTIGVTFKVTTKDGRLIPMNEIDAAGIWVSGPVTNYQHILPGKADQVLFDDVVAMSKLNDDGTYTYVFSDPIPASYGAPINDTTKFTEGELTGPLDAGTYTIAMAFSKDYWTKGILTPDANATTFDFGLNQGALDEHELITPGNCNQCHERIQMHGGQFKTPGICGTCHTSGAEDFGSTDANDATPETIDFRVMIHKLHNGAHLPSVNGLSTAADGSRVYGAGKPYVVGSTDFSGVLFPGFPNFSIAMPKNAGYSKLSTTAPPGGISDRAKDDNVRKGVTSCFNCHGDPDGAGPNPAPKQGDNAYDHPTMRACGSCHDDLDYTLPYTKNGFTMPENSTPDQCTVCHKATGGTFPIKESHLHPVTNPAITPVMTLDITAMTGATGPNGQFLVGDAPSITFTVKDAQNANVPIGYFDSFSLGVTGPNQNRQVVIPGALTNTPFDVAGRLAAASTTNKGTMSKVYPGATAVTETFTVDFTSATAFTVTGSVSGNLGSGALPASPGTYPSGASITNVVLTSAAVAQNITVSFTTPTTYTVTGTSTGAMGNGVLPNGVSNTQRFTSSDGSVAFNVVLGSTAAVAGNSFYMTVFKGGAANPGMFAIVGGRTAFAATDRFYFDFVAPAPSYTMAVPMDLQFEHLGDADGNAGQTFTAGNLPVYRGRQTLWERTALAGAPMTTNAAVSPMARYVFVTSLDPGLASNDYVVIEDGLGNEEYSRVSGIDANLKRIQLSAPLRYAHAAGVSVQEATFTYRQEGASNYYVLNPAAGTITLNAAATAGNAFVLSYRTAGRFGWKRKAGDSVQAMYYAPLAESSALDETMGDWRGKSFVDGTYSVAIWGYRSIELTSGGMQEPEWQTYRDTTAPGMKDFLFGATAATIESYDKIDAGANCNGCHDYISFHGGGRLSADTCMMCHGTPGPAVNFRTVLHGAHAEAFPVFPNGSAECSKCHGQTDVTVPTNRTHPKGQTKPAQDWNVACNGCHDSTSAVAHADTMVSPSGYESCETCHGPGRDLAVEQMHKAR